MISHTVTEAEPEDWRHIREMSLNEALEILESDSISGYLGSYNSESKDMYHFEKARIYYAIERVCFAARKTLPSEKE